jgi:nucleoside-diphosphate-sugar epimerase
MKVFVAGATGALGSRVVPLLVHDAHRVTAIARTADKAAALRAVGAEPVEVGLFDPRELTQAVAGHDVVANLATHIPDLSRAARSSAWAENDHIRTEGARNLVDAALAGGASRYIQESICFFYVDGGADWLTEEAPMDAPAFAAAFLSAEEQAARFGDSGGVGVALRFAMFYGAGTSHTGFQVRAARRGLSPFPGPKDGYQTFIHVDDAASAVVAALEVPSGVYNVAEDEPATRRDLGAAIAAALGRRRVWSVPGVARLGGKKTAYLSRSVRVSNRKFRQASGWVPSYPTPVSGWAQVTAAMSMSSASS